MGFWSSADESPYDVQPFRPLFTINETAYVAANRSTVWPIVKAMDQWDTFQDIFKIEFLGGNGAVELGQEFRINLWNIFPFPFPVATVEEYNEIVEEERLCWTVKEVQFLGINILGFRSPSPILETARCVELFDDKVTGGTMIHNWISGRGILQPAVSLFTTAITEACFSGFNAELAVEFVMPN